MNIYLAVILVAIIGGYVLSAVARYLNRRALDPELPAEFQGVLDPDRYRLSQRYTRDRQTLGTIADSVETLVLLTVILLGGFNLLDQWLRGFGLGPILTGLGFFAAVGVVHGLLSLPVSVYDTFVLEERYGFNRTTPKLFVMDRLKGLALSVVIGAPVLGALLWFFQALGGWAWLVAWGFVTAVSLFFAAFGPSLILPLFNRFTPLEDGPLRSRIEDYAKGQGFGVGGIFVIDGSKRSTKANAYFTGLGRRKRIALFDTLLDAHADDEVLAVLAHEVGHSKLGHVRRMLVAGVLRTGLLLGLAQLFIASPGLFAAFGMQEPSVYAGLMFFMLLYSPVSLALGVFGNWVSRRYEYAADAFAARTTGLAPALAEALKRLSVTNMANLTPHPLTVFLYYSHPPVLARVRTLKSMPRNSSEG